MSEAWLTPWQITCEITPDLKDQKKSSLVSGNELVENFTYPSI